MADIDPRWFSRVVRRWWWLCLVLALVAGGMAGAITARQPAMYMASAKLQVHPALISGIDSYDAIQSSQSQAESYRQSITLRPLLMQVVNVLRLPYDASVLQRHVTANTVMGTNFVTVSVSDHDPKQAADIANTIAREFMTFQSAQFTQQAGPAQQMLESQIATTRQQLAATEEQIKQLVRDPHVSDPSIQSQLTTLGFEWSQQQDALNRLLASASQIEINLAAAKNQITIAEEALPPTIPYAPRTNLAVLIAMLGGIGLGLAAMGAIGYLGRMHLTERDVPVVAASPVLAMISAIPRLNAGSSPLYFVHQPQTKAAEAIRLLRTALTLEVAEQHLKTLAVTGPVSGEGTSTLTANLAVAFGQAGRSVVIIDANLRHPSQHHIFAAPNWRGLTALLTDPQQPWRWAAHDVAPNVTLIPSGSTPSNPAELLSLDRFGDRLREVATDVDVVLLDTPAILTASDSMEVAAQVNGVLLVCHAGKTRVDVLRASADLLHRSRGRFVGIVLNHPARRRQRGERRQLDALSAMVAGAWDTGRVNREVDGLHAGVHESRVQ